MELKNAFQVPLGVDDTFRLLLDVERVMRCVPEAELLETLDDRTYKYKITVRLGPVSLGFVGIARIEEADAESKRARLSAKGTDAKGRGGADALVTFRLEPDGAATRVDVGTTLTLSGAVAQYGRASGVVAGVAGELTRQFARRLAAMLAADGATP